MRSGKAILFAGADFSKDSFNFKGKKLPLPKELSKEICKLGSFSPSEDLIYTSERYLTENEEKGDKEKLIQLLRSNYEVEIPSESSKNILKAPWNKFYTTNYDDTLEKIDREIIPVDLSSSLDKVEIKDKRCVHINGFIKKLSLESLEKSFKLTESSYLSSKGFLESPWYTVFKRDLERCSALVFVGYSLYDMDIKRILVNIENLKDNTYFIVKDKILEKEEFLFKKFGTIIKIGVENF
ncbi:MAG: SIR2 family protein [Desulfovibrionaceae bacterium]|nr:SIR2 family protein [Desulfovibrionaceae bacterium]